jgi:vitamin B12 transporter
LGSSARFDLDRSWRIVASWSQGFKAPTLSQLYGYGGNATLKPETSNGFEAGLEYGQRNGDRHLALTLFRRDNSNLIDYLSPTGYFNVSRTRAQGGELEGQLQVEQLRLSAAYTYLDVTDRSNGKDLARRPRHLATLSADWQTPLHALSLGADLRLVGDSFDDRANLTRLSGYGLLTLRASVPLGTHLELYGRVENMTDKAYQTVAGYGTYGRSAYGGVRVKW